MTTGLLEASTCSSALSHTTLPVIKVCEFDMHYKSSEEKTDSPVVHNYMDVYVMMTYTHLSSLVVYTFQENTHWVTLTSYSVYYSLSTKWIHFLVWGNECLHSLQNIQTKFIQTKFMLLTLLYQASFKPSPFLKVNEIFVL